MLIIARYKETLWYFYANKNNSFIPLSSTLNVNYRYP